MFHCSLQCGNIDLVALGFKAPIISVADLDLKVVLLSDLFEFYNYYYIFSF